MINTVTADFGGKEITIQTGKIAKQANAAVTVQVGGTVVLVAVVATPTASESAEFFPLTVDYRDKFYAVGKIPGGYFKREGKPADSETLKARLIDRPLRPLFPENYFNEVQVYVTVLSADKENPPEVLAVIGASCALYISDIPFTKPIAAVRIGMIDGQLIVNPTHPQIDESPLDLVVAGTKNAVTMVESGANELTEDEMLAAVELAHSEIVKLIDMLEELRNSCGKEKVVVPEAVKNEEMIKDVETLFNPHLEEIYKIFDKTERYSKIDEILASIQEQLAEKYPEQEKEIRKIYDNIFSEYVRKMIVEKKIRPDGRKLDEIRTITCETGILPRTHGSALFTRGQTQSLGVVTLGSPDDKQYIDSLLGLQYKKFLLHYNFPSYSVGEVRRLGGPGRREIGHGALAERALFPMLPNNDDFPYTIRVVSEILESNGSSSMASVCSATLSLMDAGVPIKAPVAGIAMGLIKQGDAFAVLSDIQGLEDHIGDMDFKVTGTAKGITALQMDIKIEGVTFEIMKEALKSAKVGREFILGKMLEAMPETRKELSEFAPRIETIKIPVDKIGTLIGPGGKMIKSITEESGAKIEIQDDGTVYVTSEDCKATEIALRRIGELTAEAELNKIYTGKVKKVAEFGAFVEIFPGKEGLLHISELDAKRVAKVEDICKEGDMVTVKVIAIEPGGKIKLSRKKAMETKE